MEQTASSAESLRHVVQLALARLIRLLQQLRQQRDALVQTQTDLRQLEELRCADADRMAELRLQLEDEQRKRAAAAHESSALEAALQKEIAKLAAANEVKREVIERLTKTALEGERHVAETQSQLEQSQSQLEALQAQCGGMREQLVDQATQLARDEERIAQLEVALVERMRWIESLETTQTMHRKRIAELYEHLRLFLSLSGAEWRAGAGGDGMMEVAESSAAAAANELEITLMQAELAGLGERVKVLPMTSDDDL